jgi:branched-chain amino acid transport system ATP-binding protein
MKMLTLKDVDTFYGDVQVLKEISLEVPKGKIVAVLGSNGAGKTTALHTISGVLHPRRGEITYLGGDISRLPAYEIVRLGISLVPERRELFYQMTIYENLEMGAYGRSKGKEVKKDVERMMEIFPILKERQKQMARTLSGGEQQMLAIARGLMSRPKLMLLDEPSLGLSPIFVQKLFAIIQQINQDGTTLLLVEQNAHLALQMAHYAVVLETGRITLAGEAKELVKEEKVKHLYLGG